jgi:hypothetical protein
MTSEVRYEIKNFITCYLTWKYWQKFRVGSYVTNTNNDQLILFDPFEDEDSSTDWSSKLLTMRSKEKKECYSLILIELIITLLYIGFGNLIYLFKYF